MKSSELYLRLLRYVLPYKGRFLLSLLGMMLIAATEPIFPAVLKFIVDGGFSKAEVSFHQILPVKWLEGYTMPVKFAPLLVVLLFIVRGLGSFIATFAISWVGGKLVLDLRSAMFAQLTRLPNRYFNQHATGNLISKLTFDVTQVTSAATNVVTVGVRDTLTVLGLLAYLLWTDWKLTLVSLIAAPLMALVVRTVSRRLRGVARGAQAAMGRMTSTLQEAIEGHRVMKIFGGQRYEQQRFADSANTVRQLGMKQAVTSSLNTSLIELLAASAVALIMALAITGSVITTAGGFIAFIIAMALLFAPLKRLTSVNEPLQRGLAAAESVFAVLDEMPEDDRGTLALERARGQIAFRDVTFRYEPDAAPTLSHVDLAIEPGETVALVGASGSGKTTLVSLIPRFFHASEGRILIDAQPIENITLASLRANIALVSQDVVLFNDSLAANIAYGRLETTSREQVVAAARAAHAMEFIQAMPQGLDAVIGEHGVRLSGGQRQRIAIARALVKNAPILILDEATSALDTESEKHVQAALETLMQGRTTIVIAHRLSTIENADRIVVLDHGHVAEVGSHAELITRGAIYARLHAIQFGTYTVEPQA